MDDKQNKESRDIQENNTGSPLSTIVRKSFRIPLKDKDSFFVIIDGISYPLTDIGPMGICINIKSKDLFSSDLLLSNCDLHLLEKKVIGIDGLVVHCSPGRKGSWLYGIKWQNLDPETEKEIDSIVNGLRDKIFEK